MRARYRRRAVAGGNAASECRICLKKLWKAETDISVLERLSLCYDCFVMLGAPKDQEAAVQALMDRPGLLGELIRRDKPWLLRDPFAEEYEYGL